MKKLIVVLLFILALLPVCAAAESMSYRYGGSGCDILYEATISADGRIVLTGTTDSSDGTLSTRTKTGRSGWALCIDMQGNVLWNYCTRIGSHDTLRYPVFLADGSVTMLLDTSHSGLYEVVWIKLDAQGREVARKTLQSRGVPWIVRGGGVLDAYQSGYVIDALNKKTTENMSLYYTFDGEFVKEMDYVEVDHFPVPVLPDGTRIEIQNDQDLPLDITVSFIPPSDGGTWEEAGFYTFTDTPPETLRQALMASPWHSAAVLSGGCDMLDGQWRYAQIILEDRNGYWLCCGVYDPEKGWQLEASRRAIRQDEPPTLLPIAQRDSFTPDTIRAAGGCEFFEIRYPDVSLLWGYQPRWGRFVLCEATLASGEDVQIIGNTLSSARSAGNALYHDFGFSLEDFDLSMFPSSMAEAERRAASLPGSDLSNVRLMGNDSIFPSIPMYKAPDPAGPVIAYYMSGVNGEALQESQDYALLRIGSMQGYVPRYNALIGGERAQMEYDTSGAPGRVYGTQPQPLLASPEDNATVITALAPAAPVEILGRIAGSPFLQVKNADGQIGFMLDTQVLIGWESFDGYYTLKVVPESGALLYSQPDENSTPIGQCMAGAQVGRLVEPEDVLNWQRVIINGYDGYMRAEDLENVQAFTIMP